MLREPIGVLSDGVEVFDRPRSHLPENDELLQLVRQALPRIDVSVNDTVKAYVFDFGYEVGKKVMVPTQDGDEIVYARRKNRKGLSRFVKGKEGTATNEITIVLMKNTKTEDLFYILITAFFGSEVPKEPWDAHAEADSKEFWNNHAFVWGSSEIVPGSETTDCPW